MSDNFNNIMDNIIRFIAGERPSADKFNALVAYFSQNSQELNNALGDIRGENNPFSRNGVTLNRLTIPWGRQIGSDDSVNGAHLYGRYLDIANIGRLIGPSSNLNNRYLSSGSFKIQNEQVNYPSTEHKTKYPIFDEQSVVITKDGIPLEKIQPSESFSSENQYKYYNGSIIFSSLTNQNTVIEYTTNPSNYGSGANYQGSRFNVIPDPNDTNKLDILAVQGGFVIELPFIGAAQSNLNQETVSNLNNEHVNRTKEDGTHQKYLLPKVLGKLDDKNTIEDAKASNQIPKYFLYLKCEDTEEVFLDADYYYMNESKIYVENIDLGNCDLNNDIFRIVTVGTDITTSIDDLRVKFIKHSHDGTFGEEAVRVQSLTGLFDNQTGNVYTKSVSSKNPLTSYLHRDGFDSRNQEDINANNMMRGHLVIGNTVDGNQKPSSVSGTTYKLAFGRPANDNNADLLTGDAFVGGVATLSLDNNENLITRSAAGKSLTNYFQSIYSINGYLNNSFTNRMELKASNSFLEEESKYLLSVLVGTSLSLSRIIDLTKSVDFENTKEITSILENTEYKISATKHHAVLSDIFEIGPKVNLRENDHLGNPEVGETLSSFKSRVEKGIIYNSGKENIISGGLLHPENTTTPPTRTFLNLNADLYRKERNLLSIGYNENYNALLGYVKNNNNDLIPGYIIRETNCDVVIGKFDSLTNRNNTTGIKNGAINIYLDLKYEAGNRSNYLKNNYAGTEFNINILFGETVNTVLAGNANQSKYYINIMSLGDSIYSINRNVDERRLTVGVKNFAQLEDTIRLVNSNYSFYQNDSWNVQGAGFDKGGFNNVYSGPKYISITAIDELSGVLPGASIVEGSILNLKGTLFQNPILTGTNSDRIDNATAQIPPKQNIPLVYQIDVNGMLIRG